MSYGYITSPLVIECNYINGPSHLEVRCSDLPGLHLEPQRAIPHTQTRT